MSLCSTSTSAPYHDGGNKNESDGNPPVWRQRVMNGRGEVLNPAEPDCGASDDAHDHQDQEERWIQAATGWLT